MHGYLYAKHGCADIHTCLIRVCGLSAQRPWHALGCSAMRTGLLDKAQFKQECCSATVFQKFPAQHNLKHASRGCTEVSMDALPDSV